MEQIADALIQFVNAKFGGWAAVATALVLIAVAIGIIWIMLLEPGGS